MPRRLHRRSETVPDSDEERGFQWCGTETRRKRGKVEYVVHCDITNCPRCDETCADRPYAHAHARLGAFVPRCSYVSRPA